MDAKLSRRERQIMDIVYTQGQATAGEIQEALPDPPSYSTVRTLLRILEDKGHLRHQKQGTRYLYLPTQPRQSVAQQALSQVLRTFFEGSISQAVASLLHESDTDLSDAELERLSHLVEQAREEGKQA